MVIKKENTKNIYFVYLYFLLFSVFYLIYIPPFEAPDENLHLDYINFISKHKKLPNQYLNNDHYTYVGQGHQHPLYYLAGGLLINIFSSDGTVDTEHPSKYDKYWHGGIKNSYTNNSIFKSNEDKILFYLLRSLSLVFSLVTLIFSYKLSGLFFKEDKLRILSVFLAASLPQFQFISAVINNDSLANMFSVICIYYTFKMIQFSGSKNFIAAGIALGLGLLTKKTLLFIFPCTVIIYIILLFSKGKKQIQFKNIILFCISFIIISAFVFVRNYLLYGDILGSEMEKVTMTQFLTEKSIFSYYFINPFAVELFHSFVGVFGWMNIPLPSITGYIYLVFFASGFGYGTYYAVKEKNFDIIFALLFIISCLAGIVYFNLTFTQYQGRYMFPVLSLIFIISLYGINKLKYPVPPKRVWEYAYIAFFVIFFLIDLTGAVVLSAHYN